MAKKALRIGVLAFHGDVLEHELATAAAAEVIDCKVAIIAVRSKADLAQLDGLIIPGGESTTLYKLCVREDMVAALQEVPAIFGTCAGAIMLAKIIANPAEDQKTLALMDLTIERNAYGRQTESFETDIQTPLGETPAIFIRAPKITNVGPSVKILAEYNGDSIACEQIVTNRYYLALTFHPELTTAKFHEYFLQKLCTS